MYRKDIRQVSLHKSQTLYFKTKFKTTMFVKYLKFNKLQAEPIDMEYIKCFELPRGLERCKPLTTSKLCVQ